MSRSPAKGFTLIELMIVIAIIAIIAAILATYLTTIAQLVSVTAKVDLKLPAGVKVVTQGKPNPVIVSTSVPVEEAEIVPVVTAPAAPAGKANLAMSAASPANIIDTLIRQRVTDKVSAAFGGDVEVQSLSMPYWYSHGVADPCKELKEAIATGTMKLQEAMAELKKRLEDFGPLDLIVCGFMSHSSVSTTVRAAKNLGFRCTLVEDACATRDLPHKGGVLSADAEMEAIVALHESPRVRGWFKAREEGRGRRLLRGLGSLLLTGIAVELALMPIGLFHFHKAGVYGALANIVAIPLTTFVIMPLEALALALDLAGIGAPIWWLTARALDLLLWLAHVTASAPGAVAALPAMPGGAYALLVTGGLWVALWRTRVRWAGSLPFALGLGWALLTPAPDLLVTGDLFKRKLVKITGPSLSNKKITVQLWHFSDYALIWP